ncbi:helix-turn-helix domain-containing protein [Kibdelosporangium phytohabitans]|uniref:helix-turn-helix domain-containing protein n=1 Tax=Kibdelosporangium phytohabitans TaxID=860235 RepID=UPI000B036CD0
MRASRRTATHQGDNDSTDSNEVSRPRHRKNSARPPGHRDNAPDELPQLHTPGEAAEILTVKESWLRRKAGQRLIPCTFVGKHLRFSTADLRQIADTGHQDRRTSVRRQRR